MKLSEQSFMKQPATQHQPCVGAAKDHHDSPFKVLGICLPFCRSLNQNANCSNICRLLVPGKKILSHVLQLIDDIKLCPPMFHLTAEAVLPGLKGMQAAWLS